VYIIKIKGKKVGKLLKYNPKDEVAIRDKIYNKYKKFSFGTLNWTDIEIIEE